jgi:hypothetical protein
MKISTLGSTILLLGACVSSSHAALVSTFNVIGNEPSEIQSVVDEFRNALGPNNGNAPVAGNPNGRRQINWDALPDGLADPNPFAGDFFNGNSAPRARGIEFEATGSTTGFLVSSTIASGQPAGFGFPDALPAFSGERLFSPVNGTTFDIKFFDPTDQTTQATVRGFGAVFSGLSFNDTVQMQFLNLANEIIGTNNPLGELDNRLSFSGAIFDSAEIAIVRIIGGDRFLAENGRFRGPSGDGYVLDDFIFGEPIAVDVSAPKTMAMFSLAMIAFVAFRKKTRLSAKV